MRKTTRYSNVESVTYEFDRWDIQRALFKDAGIAETLGPFPEFEMDGETETVTIVVRAESPKEAR